MENAILVIVEWDGEEKWLADDMQAELTQLSRTAHACVVETFICSREKPTANFFIGKGKLEEISGFCRSNNIDVAIFNDNLTPTQQRNLEQALDTKVVDRTQLILDIFALHAKSQEGKVQIELAQLDYLLPRLLGKGVLLSRLGGGIGTRGPGEQKLEYDRRRIKNRIAVLKKELIALGERRKSLRKNRTEYATPTVAIIGYTNAGKSTLLNALTNANAIARDELFSTVDPITRKFVLPNNQRVVFTDTVGFLHNLPHNLIEAFKATLEEVHTADILLHVLDISHPRFMEHNDAVFEVLAKLDANDKPMIYALNKTDKLDEKILISRYERYFEHPVGISALKREGLDKLIDKIQFLLAGRMQKIKIFIPHQRMDLVNIVHKQGKIFQEKHTPSGIFIEAQLPGIIAKKLLTTLKSMC